MATRMSEKQSSPTEIACVYLQLCLLALVGPLAALAGGLQQPGTLSLDSWLCMVSLAATGYVLWFQLLPGSPS